MAVIIICIVQVIYLEEAMQARGKYANVRNSKLFIHYILHIALAVQLGQEMEHLRLSGERNISSPRRSGRLARNTLCPSILPG